MLAARIKRQIAPRGAGRSGLGKGQSSEQKRGERKGDREEFIPPPPPPIAQAPPTRSRRGGRRSESRQRSSRPSLYTSAPAPSFLRPHPSFLRRQEPARLAAGLLFAQPEDGAAMDQEVH